ncbi:MAG: Spy/CpxP family protein refolding chaperone [Sulfuricella sp.]|nr:Spy/CpxP family protein refolding chaperone [Sulfuricella sp.]
MKTFCSSLIRALLAASLALPLAALAGHPGLERGAGPAPCEASRPAPPPPFGAEMLPGDLPLPPFLHGVKLSEEQRDRIFAIQHEQSPLQRENAKTARKALDELRALAFSDQYDDQKAQALAANGARAIAAMALQRVRTEQKILALLTSAQRTQVEQLKARMDGHCGGDSALR